ncbi:MAG TPA: aldo/keto reductase, partial [Candidatus Bathyarchaeia archaeon]|nr:aldo/keto reductase [Candidatus Bathyarchaeia archaeon]
TRVGIGTAPIGSMPGWRIYWGPQDEKAAVKAIQTALDVGVNWIDTAPWYGWGRAEEIVGKAIKDRRDDVYIFTKCGTVSDGKGGEVDNLKPDSIKREIDEILKRLQTDHIDLLQFHDPDYNTPIEESWQAVEKLIRDGKVRHGGLSNHPVDLVQRALTVGPVTSNQVQYNPLQRKIETDILPFSQRNSIGVLGWGSLAEGFLTDSFDLDELDSKDFRRRHAYAQPESKVKIERVRETLRRIARARRRTMADVVVAWELMQPALTGAIIGIRNEKEAKQMIGGAELVLTRDEKQEIDQASS